ncbi:hypothetical protein [Methanoregula formicica]|uniref:Uncharacterized protein n=1 Tax=Methanoregula formicica (strain DSM 22288 / NBRC 105244 / SMSP) TaxID=593750 RepID=L0HAH0_METFS|nr:hypothetical protein [Methanoregula formicica]AGB01722.1 hypothetical protein Metfor_0662 [Methanoregula formicica SMSP]
MTPAPLVSSVVITFTRHDRWYCIFSVADREEEFLYYTHHDKPLRSLMFGDHFVDQLPGLMKKEDLCIECGLGLSVKGGVALDDGDLIAWHCTVEEANAILTALQETSGNEGKRISLF